MSNTATVRKSCGTDGDNDGNSKRLKQDDVDAKAVPNEIDINLNSSSSSSSSSSLSPPSSSLSGNLSPSTSSPRLAASKPKPHSSDSYIVQPDNFEAERHFYPRVQNASVHPMVSSFMKLGNDTIATRYCHLHPAVKIDQLKAILAKSPRHFMWSGCDLFNVTNAQGQKQMIVIETNSCPSGQKSFPQTCHESNQDGYHLFMATTFQHFINSAPHPLPKGGLAVIYDKNPMEATGYAEAMATVLKEPVHVCTLYEDDVDPSVQFIDGVMHVRPPPPHHHSWIPIRAAFRYVTQRPWTRIPVVTKTMILNPIVSCLAGGRNKMAADKAYEFYNKEIHGTGLCIRTPETLRDIKKEEIPIWVKSMGGHAVVKVPYSNAGQGVYTITSPAELQAFMAEPNRYEKYIVQSLVGNASWSSITRQGQYFHAGTIPNKKNQTFVNDLRMMVSATPSGFQPVALYARRALKPLVEHITPEDDSWGMLGTNLSVKKSDGSWDTETERLLMMDIKDFNKLGLGIDDLIDAYVQTVLATTAIDKMANRLISKENGAFDFSLYRSLNDDSEFIKEVMLGQEHAKRTHNTNGNGNANDLSSSSSSSSSSSH